MCFVSVYSVRNMDDSILGENILVLQWYSLSHSSQTLSHPLEGKWRGSSSIHESLTNQILLLNFETLASVCKTNTGADGLPACCTKVFKS